MGVRGKITKILFSDGKRKRKIGAGHPPFFRKRRSDSIPAGP
jgi:hypothetical protein